MRVCDDSLHGTTLQPIAQLVALKERRRGNEDCAELDRGQHRFPQRDDVSQHEEDAIAGPDAERR